MKKEQSRMSNSRKEGIDRVRQRPGEMQKGQGGKMSGKPREKAEWRRPDKAGTPRPA
jgi:hypothetical protein